MHLIKKTVFTLLLASGIAACGGSNETDNYSPQGIPHNANDRHENAQELRDQIRKQKLGPILVDNTIIKDVHPLPMHS